MSAFALLPKYEALVEKLNNTEMALSIEEGMRKECEEYIAVLKADLAAAQAEVALNRNLLNEASVEKAEAKREVVRLEAEAAALRALLIRYRNEVPLGHQPHMIAHLVDAAIDKARGGNG